MGGPCRTSRVPASGLGWLLEPRSYAVLESETGDGLRDRADACRLFDVWCYLQTRDKLGEEYIQAVDCIWQWLLVLLRVFDGVFLGIHVRDTGVVVVGNIRGVYRP